MAWSQRHPPGVLLARSRSIFYCIASSALWGTGRRISAGLAACRLISRRLASTPPRRLTLRLIQTLLTDIMPWNVKIVFSCFILLYYEHFAAMFWPLTRGTCRLLQKYFKLPRRPCIKMLLLFILYFVSIRLPPFQPLKLKQNFLLTAFAVSHGPGWGI